MGIEVGIYNNLLRPPKSVAEYDAEAMQGQQNKLALQMQQMQMAGQQRGIEQENALAGAYKTAVGVDGAMDRNKLYAAVAQAGGGAKLPSIQKAYADQDKVAADADKTKGETKKAAREDAEHQFELAGQLAGAWANNPAVTKQQIQSGLTAAMRAGMINDEIGNAKLQELAGVGDDVPSLNVWANRTLMQVMKAKDQFALTTVDANTKEKSRVDTENSLRSAASSKYSADSSASTSRANNLATIAQSERSSLRSDDRARDFNGTRVEENRLKREQKDDVANMTKASQVASFDTMLGTLDRLSKHEGLSNSVGIVGKFPTLPGSRSANFQAELDTFQSQAFIPMVAQLKGMGALSDAEGKKLTAAVGALNPNMGETAFRESIGRITTDMMAAKGRVSGKAAAPPSDKPGIAPKKPANNIDALLDKYKD